MAINFGITFVRHFAQNTLYRNRENNLYLYTIYNMSIIISLQIPFKELEVKIYGWWKWQPVTEFNIAINFCVLQLLSFSVGQLQWLYTVFITRIKVVSSSKGLNTEILMYYLHMMENTLN